MDYDRAFLVKGSVVKIYKNEESQGPHQRLEYVMHLPVLKDSKGQVLEPENLLLHNQESNLMFLDKKSQLMINFDLEKGKIVDEIKYPAELVQDGQLKMTNEMKNSQTQASQIFQAISQKSMFTVDTRLSSKDRVAVERVYKKSPQFSAVAANALGGLVLGSMDGAIRLYKQVG